MSSSGAYRDFPSYYYEKGNLFGAFLLGHTPETSWDVRTEAERLGTLSIPDAPARRRSAAGRPARPTPPAAETELSTELGRYVQSHLAQKGARRILVALQAARGEVVATTGDPHVLFDAYVARNLTEKEQQTVLLRLKFAALQEKKAMLSAQTVKKQKPRKQVRPSKPRARAARSPRERQAQSDAPATSKPRSKPKVQVAAPKKAVVASTCALCGASLSEAERARSAASHALFLGQAYCAVHARQVAALFGAGEQR